MILESLQNVCEVFTRNNFNVSSERDTGLNIPIEYPASPEENENV